MDFRTNGQGRIVRMLGERNHQSLMKFLGEESGQDLIEYVLLAAVLGLAGIAGVKGVAANVLAMWQSLATNFSAGI